MCIFTQFDGEVLFYVSYHTFRARHSKGDVPAKWPCGTVPPAAAPARVRASVGRTVGVPWPWGVWADVGIRPYGGRVFRGPGGLGGCGHPPLRGGGCSAGDSRGASGTPPPTGGVGVPWPRGGGRMWASAPTGGGACSMGDSRGASRTPPPTGGVQTFAGSTVGWGALWPLGSAATTEGGTFAGGRVEKGAWEFRADVGIRPYGVMHTYFQYPGRGFSRRLPLYLWEIMCYNCAIKPPKGWTFL